MKNFKPRKSVKRFICETLISALVLTVILGIIYYQERLWVLAMVLIFILDVLFCMFEEIKEYRIDDDGTVHVVCYLGFSKVVLKGITKVYFDPQRKALRIIAEKVTGGILYRSKIVCRYSIRILSGYGIRKLELI